MQRITHVIFDLDGTLLDTEPLYVQAFDAIFRRFGRSYTTEMDAEYKGLPTDVGVRRMIESTGIPITVAELTTALNATMHETYPTALPTRGARELTRHLAESGIPMAIATSSTRAAVSLKFTHHADWLDEFAAVVTVEDVVSGKPAPDIFVEAARRLGARPQHCLVFEDAAPGVDAALAAGMQVVGVTTPGFEDDVRRAHARVASLWTFDPSSWSLPPYPDRRARSGG